MPYVTDKLGNRTWKPESAGAGFVTEPGGGLRLGPGASAGPGGSFSTGLEQQLGSLPAPITSQIPYGSSGESSQSERVFEESLRRLPPDVREEYINRITGGGEDLAEAGETYGQGRGLSEKSLMQFIDSPGFTEEEREQLLVSPEEEAGIVRLAGLPIAGAANRARQSLMRYTSAAGYNPGMNATLERIQQEQGRQAGEAVLQARLGVLGQRRAGTQTTGEARMGQQEAGARGARELSSLDIGREADIRRSQTSLLTSFPETDVTSTRTAERESEQIATPTGVGLGGGGGAGSGGMRVIGYRQKRVQTPAGSFFQDTGQPLYATGGG